MSYVFILYQWGYSPANSNHFDVDIQHMWLVSWRLRRTEDGHINSNIPDLVCLAVNDAHITFHGELTILKKKNSGRVPYLLGNSAAL